MIGNGDEHIFVHTSNMHSERSVSDGQLQGIRDITETHEHTIYDLLDQIYRCIQGIPKFSSIEDEDGVERLWWLNHKSYSGHPSQTVLGLG